MRNDIDPRYIFQHIASDGVVVTFEVDSDANLTTMCETFNNFLRGCGYSFDGYVEIVDDGPNEKLKNLMKGEDYDDNY